MGTQTKSVKEDNNNSCKQEDDSQGENYKSK